MSAVTEDKSERSSSLIHFAIKVGIVAVVISLCTIFVADAIMWQLEEVIAGTLGTATGTPFWTKVERELDRAADPASELPPKKKQKLINDVRVIVARWRPLVDAVQVELQKPASKE